MGSFFCPVSTVRGDDSRREKVIGAARPFVPRCRPRMPSVPKAFMCGGEAVTQKKGAARFGRRLFLSGVYFAALARAFRRF